MEYIRQRALNGEFLAGAWCNMGSPVSAEIAASLGYDWLLIDQEHGPGDNWTLLHQVQAASRYAATVIVRLPWVDRILTKKALDLGCGGIMIPYVQEAETAKEVIRYAKYLPEGERGVASSPRCSNFSLNFQEYFAKANQNLITIAQIETGKSVENAESIAAVAGIDVLFIGPLDLSLSTKHPAMFEDEQFVSLLAKVGTAAKNQGKAAGILLPNAKGIPLLKSLGFTFIACGTDSGMVVNSMKSTFESLHA